MGILRVIAGSARGRRLRTVAGNSVRPTSDLVKESLFNILAPCIEGAGILDLFSGTGSLAIEALSRGAAYAVLVDSSRESVKVAKGNLADTELGGRAETITLGAAEALALLGGQNRKFDIILLDPPYGKGLVEASLEAIAESRIAGPGCIIAAERHRKDGIPSPVCGFRLTDERKYGDTVLSFFKEG